MRKPAFCICKNKDADQLNENWFSCDAADISKGIIEVTLCTLGKLIRQDRSQTDQSHHSYLV